METLEALVEQAYELFADYPATFPLNVCDCGGCMPREMQHSYLSIPLREWSEAMMRVYQSSAIVIVGEAADGIAEFKHFLPRIAQGIIRLEDTAITTEMAWYRAHFSQRECWLPAEIDWAKRFARAWFAHLLHHGCHPLSENLTGFLCMFQHAELDMIPELLQLWTQHSMQPTAIDEFVAILEELPDGGNAAAWDESCLCYLPEYGYRNEEFAAVMNGWLLAPETRQAFLQALALICPAMCPMNTTPRNGSVRMPG
ncbi:hypothetical protein [Eikenella sp. Marseille-P7795]|uniref:hypothetical protein n=1 Tax=Eikenella sp. Marseille-P7795 TaxID=2866577 RepID=UPI001CE4A92C|nr:hypothetical protein [Eikenella sp. Marseille-P7795]